MSLNPLGSKLWEAILKHRFIFCFFFLIFVSLISGIPYVILAVLLVYGLGVFLFRKRHSLAADAMEFDNNMIFSPVNGKVVEIIRGQNKKDELIDYNSIRIVSHILNEYGVYFPLSSEIHDITWQEGIPSFRYLYKKEKEQQFSKMSVWVKNKTNRLFGIEFIPCLFGMAPKIFLGVGDRGKSKVNFGHVPFGGTTIIHIPKEFDLKINSGTKLVAGETLIGCLEENLTL